MEPSAPPPLRHEKLSNKYIVGRKIGSGHFGVVREVTNRATGEKLACKIVPKTPSSSAIADAPSSNERHHQRLLWEVALTQDLSARNDGIVKVVDACEDEKRVNIVMELCRGGNLADYIETKRATWEEEAEARRNPRQHQHQRSSRSRSDSAAGSHAAGVGEGDETRRRRRELVEVEAGWVIGELAGAIAQCHASGVVHRDVKPENVLLTAPVRSGDFASGFAQMRHAGAPDATAASAVHWKGLRRCVTSNCQQNNDLSSKKTPPGFLGRLLGGLRGGGGIPRIAPSASSNALAEMAQAASAASPQQSSQRQQQAVRLADFGLAEKLTGREGAHVTSGLVGSPAYVAPEVVEGRSDVGFPSDIWGLGIILYYLLSEGRLPFSGRTTAMLLRNIRRAQLDTSAPALLGASAEAKEVLRRLLAANPEDRPTAEEVTRMEWVVEQRKKWDELAA